MTIFSSSQPSIRARVLPRFPAQVLAGNGMIITKSGGTYVFEATGIVDTLGKLPAINSDTLMGRDSAGLGPPEQITVSAGIGFTGAGGLQLQPNQRIRYITIPITGSPITTGIKADFLVPFSCTITRVTLLGDQIGIITVDIWKSTFASYPPTVANTITGSSIPTISTANKSQDSTLTGWNTTITAGDILRLNVASVATFTRVTVCLDVVTV